MKSAIATLVAALLLTLSLIPAARAEEESKPDLLLIIAKNEYTHEVRLGFLPYYVVWGRKGPPLEKAARATFKQSFDNIGMCESNEQADAILWLESELSYNPMMTTYYAKVTAALFRADGKKIATYTATGTSQDFYGSRIVDGIIQTAYTRALKQIGKQYADDATAQAAIDRSLAKAPCALVTLVPKLKE
ncbi:MAG: hypothetical protein LBV44_10100 [Methylobacillus sp.]|jgi:hypothetical protein|nr:hypothetical protein [Methylobacillus sp.]